MLLSCLNPSRYSGIPPVIAYMYNALLASHSGNILTTSEKLSSLSLIKALIEYAALPMALTIEFSTQAIDEHVRIIITFLSVIICFTIAITESIKS